MTLDVELSTSTTLVPHLKRRSMPQAALLSPRSTVIERRHFACGGGGITHSPRVTRNLSSCPWLPSQLRLSTCIGQSPCFSWKPENTVVWAPPEEPTSRTLSPHLKRRSMPHPVLLSRRRTYTGLEQSDGGAGGCDLCSLRSSSESPRSSVLAYSALTSSGVSSRSQKMTSSMSPIHWLLQVSHLFPTTMVHEPALPAKMGSPMLGCSATFSPSMYKTFFPLEPEVMVSHANFQVFTGNAPGMDTKL